VSPTPAETKIAPRKSIGTDRRSSCGLAMYVSTTAITAIGTLIQKIARQVHGSRKLPAIGPTDVSAPVMPKKIAGAFPRSRGANELTTIASAAGKRSAPTALKRTERDQPRLGPVAFRRQAAQRRRRGEPDRADENHPAMADHVAQLAAEREQRREREQIAVDHPLRAASERPTPRWMYGTAIATMVWSTNIIATEKIIAVRTR